jgi:phosphomannomutase
VVIMVETAITLRESLQYEPQELKFGTSGRRGKVEDLSQLEIYLNVLGEIEYLQGLSRAEGGVAWGEEFYFACDLRPSSTAFVAEMNGRGKIAQAVRAAIESAGMRPINLGRIPTPALAFYALARGRGSIMVTGSHIPFDRNGYKAYSARGELLKEQEALVNAQVATVRARLYSQAAGQSLFNPQGRLKAQQPLPPEEDGAQTEYIKRYTSFFSGVPLDGKRVLLYEHSAVGRDLMGRILEQLGVEVVRAGRADTFVPIDTENIDAEQLAVIERLTAGAAKEGPLYAVVSTDGDSDRPLVLGVEPGANGAGDSKVRFFGGDLVGMITAQFLKAGAVVVPVSCNDGIDRGGLAKLLEPKTRIGSPYVIAGIEAALRAGKQGVCGWEANGGFLTGSRFFQKGAVLEPLMTRDAALPVLAPLAAAASEGLTLAQVFGRLPERFSRAALLRNFPRTMASAMLARFSPEPGGRDLAARGPQLAQFFTRELGFGAIAGIDTTDGLRIRFDNGDVAHIRPSGNADELRIYAVADTQERADTIAAMGVAEPGGILRSMERSVAAGD